VAPRPARLLLLALAAWPLPPASAQVGGVPAAPGIARPLACQQLLAARDETQRHAMAISDASERKAGPEEACRLFKVFLASETKMIKGLEEHAATCGVPPDVIKSVKAQHVQAAKTGKHVCDAAAQGPRPSAPSLSDALGTTPMVPDAAGAKKGAGTYDTLTGTPLQR
jgi:hypothetical protein